MKNLLLMLITCLLFSCKKDNDKTLIDKNWVIESATVSPAMTVGNKTSTNYIELSGSASCIANMMISFSKDGTYSSGSNGALCDMISITDIKTWRRDGDQIFLSTSPSSPIILNNNKLTQTSTSSPIGGVVYTFVYVYKAQSK